jgi:gas vesicle protein
MNLRNLLTGALVGAAVALLVREFNQYGLALSDWRLPLPRGLEAVEIGAIAGALSQLINQRRSAR